MVNEIYKANLIKAGCLCNKCGLIYGLDHPEDVDWLFANGRKNFCHDYFAAKHFSANRFNLFKLKGKWYSVKGTHIQMFLYIDLIEDAFGGYMNTPIPIRLSRQVDIFRVAKQLGVEGNLSFNKTQLKRAKTLNFVESLKGRRRRY